MQASVTRFVFAELSQAERAALVRDVSSGAVPQATPSIPYPRASGPWADPLNEILNR